MNQRWAEVLHVCVLAAGSIARLRGDRMSICSNLQWIEFDGSQGCVNSWEFSTGEQHMEACQWLQDHIRSCKIGKVGSRAFSAQETASPGNGVIGNLCTYTQKKSTSLLRICVFAQIIQSWKTLLPNITLDACKQKFPHLY